MGAAHGLDRATRGPVRVRFRLPDGTVGTDSAPPHQRAAEIRRQSSGGRTGSLSSTTPSSTPPRADHTDRMGGHLGTQATSAGARKMGRLPQPPTQPHPAPLRPPPDARIGRQRRQGVRQTPARPHWPTQLRRDVIPCSACCCAKPSPTDASPSTPAAASSATGPRPERPHATTAQVDSIAARITRPPDHTLVITAAYTGMRWGELTGLAGPTPPRRRQHPRPPRPSAPCTRSAAELYLGPPKTADSARDVHLPPFLIDLLTEVLASHDHDIVFPGERGGYHAAPPFAAASGHPPSTATPPGVPRSCTACTSTTCATPTRPGSSRTTSPRSPKPTARPPPTRRPRHLQPRHPRHEPTHRRRPATPLDNNIHLTHEPAPAPAPRPGPPRPPPA